MLKHIKKFLHRTARISAENEEKEERKELEKIVREGTSKAIKEYRETFERLAQYDRA